MCGLGGILRVGGPEIPDIWLDAIDERIVPRGPDGHGRFRDRVEIATPERRVPVEIALVHRRLSIIDHAGGAQPMVSARGPDGADDNGLVAVVLNGCIYNHRALRGELESLGHRFASDHSDTEVLVHGHRAWGEGLADHLSGMYAGAIWDRSRAALTLLRDPFGKKPLYVFDSGSDGDGDGRTIAFASDAAAVAMIAARTGRTTSDPTDLLAAYLQRGYTTEALLAAPERPVARAVPAGAAWRFAFDRAADAPPQARAFDHEWTGPAPDDEEIESLLDAGVARRLEADVPLGCFLSGGVDSSLIAHLARRHDPGLRTFSVRMPDPRYDESAHAERVAAHLGTDHATLDVSPDPAEDLVTLVDRLGQPFGDSSILPTFWVSRAARVHVTVALSGDGGDELFLGYERYLAARPLARWQRGLRLVPPALLRRTHPKSRLHKLGRLGAMARDYPRTGLAATEAIFHAAQVEALLGRSPSPLPAVNPGDDALAALRDDDLVHYLPYDLLRKVDVASMSVALEVRCPFLDRDVASAARAVPIERLLAGGRRKGLLRNLARRHLPAEVVDRPKMGFAVPIGAWFRDNTGGMKTLLLDHLRSPAPFGPFDLDAGAVGRLLDEHLGGTRDHAHRLFTLLTLSIWARSL